MIGHYQYVHFAALMYSGIVVQIMLTEVALTINDCDLLVILHHEQKNNQQNHMNHDLFVRQFLSSINI